jgi:hypothetical protein
MLVVAAAASEMSQVQCPPWAQTPPMIAGISAHSGSGSLAKYISLRVRGRGSHVVRVRQFLNRTATPPLKGSARGKRRPTCPRSADRARCYLFDGRFGNEVENPRPTQRQKRPTQAPLGVQECICPQHGRLTSGIIRQSDCPKYRITLPSARSQRSERVIAQKRLITQIESFRFLT